MTLADSLVSRIADTALLPIAAKVLHGERLSFSDGCVLYGTDDLTGVGALANVVRERLHGRTVRFVRNQHINYTNVCNKQCRFCSFAANIPVGGPRPYTLSVRDIQAALLRYGDAPITEVHIVGGIDPRLPFSYYLDLLRAVREIRPDVHIKAFTAVELDQIARVSGLSLPDTLAELKKAGLSSVPGGGAEVLSDRVHRELHPCKLTPGEWLDIARAIARAGLPQYATMLYGHIETIEERVQHLILLRDLQDETGHLLAFTPLSFHPEGTDLAHLPGPTALDDLRAVAVARLMLDNIRHIKTFWIMNTPQVSQIALSYGADDMDGTVEEYRITFAEGRKGDVRQALSAEAMMRLISEAGFTPVERDGMYREVPQ
jgi:aminodeoxyfutalosine synthase